MNDHINCDQFAEMLPDLLEREVPEQSRAALESHALACDICGPLLADLRHLRVDAANLPELTPSRDLWGGISARIETPVVALPASNTRVASTERKMPVRAWWLGIAAVALIAVTATITHEVTKRAIVPSTTTAANTVASNSDTTKNSAGLPSGVASSPPTEAPTTVASTTPEANIPANHGVAPTTTKLASNKVEKPTADQTYDHEIAKLRAVLEYRRHDLDSSTVVVVDKNLKIIDDAIAQCRSALKKDPASRYLLESLNEALDSKVQLLRTAATMPPRT
ncbi:MAG TPA: zf-HC2 domain-containing protein [Gemmatimonadaceae bacterium]